MSNGRLENRCLSYGGLRVRIRLPPAVSLRTFGPSFRKPLACSGPDAVWNLQWQTIADAKAKDAWERKTCAR